MKTLKSALVVIAILTLFAVGNAMAMQEEIVGTVMQNGDSYALLAHSGEYLVIGKNLQNCVGDTVVATGEVYNGVDTQEIHVDSVKVISSKDLITPDLENANTMS